MSLRLPSLLCAVALLALASPARAQTSAPLLEPKPVFVPGMYETEARNSAFKDTPVKDITSRTVRSMANELYGHCTNASKNRLAITPAQSVINYNAEELELCQPIRVKRRLNGKGRLVFGSCSSTGVTPCMKYA